jgi:hypothetical protein
MTRTPDSLGAFEPWPQDSGSASPIMEQRTALEGAIESPPEFDRVADVLGPLEQVVLAADHQLGSIQQRVSNEAGEMSAQAEQRIREASEEQRRRVAQLREELTNRVSELAIRFDAMLNVLEEVDRSLAVQGVGDGTGDVRVTITERHRVEISHEELAIGAQEAEAVPASVAPPLDTPGPAKQENKKGIGHWFRRFKKSA